LLKAVLDGGHAERVVAMPRQAAEDTPRAAEILERKETGMLAHPRAGELGLNLDGMRNTLHREELVYRAASQET